MDPENCLRRQELHHCHLMIRCNILGLMARPLNSTHHLPTATHKILTDNTKNLTTMASTRSLTSYRSCLPHLADNPCLRVLRQ